MIERPRAPWGFIRRRSGLYQPAPEIAGGAPGAAVLQTVSAVTTGGALASNVVTFSTNGPSGLNAGDYMVGAVCVNAGAVTPTSATPSGWTLLAGGAAASGSNRGGLWVYGRYFQAGDTGVTFASGAADWTAGSAAFVARISDTHVVNAILGTPTYTAWSGAALTSGGTFSVAGQGALGTTAVLCLEIVGYTGGTGATDFTPPSPFVEQLDGGTTATSTRRIEMASVVINTGTLGSAAYTYAGTPLAAGVSLAIMHRSSLPSGAGVGRRRAMLVR